MANEQAPPCAPWWKHGHVWLLIAGPAAVVAAGVVTVWLAVSRPDPVVAEDYYRRGVEINKTLAHREFMPAMQGRNHVATPHDPLSLAREGQVSR